MLQQKLNDLEIENAYLINRNFSGKETQYKRAGERTFSVKITDPDLAEQWISEGWNVRPMKVRDINDDPAWALEVKVSFDPFPPEINLYTDTAHVVLTEASVNRLDGANIISADLVLSPYHWEVNGKTGIKAYLSTAHITIQEDKFAHKYSRYHE